MIEVTDTTVIVNLPGRYQTYVANLFETFDEAYSGNYNPEEHGPIVFVENNVDDLVKGFKWFSEEDGGVLCKSEEGVLGWCWEAVDYYEPLKLFTIFIMCNNEFGVTLLIPEEGISEELHNGIKEHLGC